MANKEELADRIRELGVYDENGDMTDPVYGLVTASVPILCVDFVPHKLVDGVPKLGIITRATGPERNKPAVLGGRVRHNESISAAIGRHLLGSFGSAVYTFHPGNSAEHPFFVQNYFHQNSAEPNIGFDPTKNAVALNFVIEDIEEPENVRDEASDFRWIGFDEIPTESAYHHHIAMSKAVEFLKQLPVTGT